MHDIGSRVEGQYPNNGKSNETESATRNGNWDSNFVLRVVLDRLLGGSYNNDNTILEPMLGSTCLGKLPLTRL